MNSKMIKYKGIDKYCNISNDLYDTIFMQGEYIVCWNEKDNRREVEWQKNNLSIECLIYPFIKKHLKVSNITENETNVSVGKVDLRYFCRNKIAESFWFGKVVKKNR